MANAATRSLITFAFVKDEFDRTGDLVAGLIPLFAPIFERLSGQIFSPAAFCDEVQQFYGIRMHPWVAEDWAPRFAQAGYLLESGDKHSRTYTCARCEPQDGPNADEFKDVLDSLIDHVSDRLSDHGVSVSKPDVESGIISRLKKPDFLNLLLKPEIKRKIGKTLSLPVATSTSAIDPEAIIDFILASRIIDQYDSNKLHFDIISRIASGALVSEIVLNLRNPPKIGQKLSNGSVVYLDSPFLIDVLDLGDRERHLYAAELVKDLKQAGAILRTFDHNVDEINSILGATLENRNDVNSAVGSVAYRLRTDSTARSRAQSIKPKLRQRLLAMGVTSVRMSDSSRGKEKYFPDDQILDLVAQIRPFGDIFSREVDAQSIGGVARQVLSVRSVANILSLPAIFITKNAPLARDATKFLVDQCNYSNDAAAPFLTDRQAAGVMWLALGGSAGSLAERQLLANCASALTPRRDVLSAVYKLLEEADENAAAEFEVLMTEDRCAHYVMEFALGDAALVTADNAVEILDQIKRIAIADVTNELEEKREQELAAERKRADENLSKIQTEHASKIDLISSETEKQKQVLRFEIESRDEILDKTTSELEQRKEEIEQQSAKLLHTQQSVYNLQRSTIVRCLKKAKTVGRNMKILIAFLVSLSIGIVGISTTVITSSMDNALVITILLGISVVITAVLATLISWVAPDWVFAWLVRPRVERAYTKAIQSEGADTFVDEWIVDLDAETVIRK